LLLIGRRAPGGCSFTLGRPPSSAKKKEKNKKESGLGHVEQLWTKLKEKALV